MKLFVLFNQTYQGKWPGAFLKTLSIKSTILDIFGKTEWIVLGPECLCHPNPCFESPIPSVMIFKTRSLWEVVKVLLGIGGGLMAL